MTDVRIFVGTGGVGKTTIAAATAVKEARAGKNVMVLTIDPSQRLARTLGLEKDQEAGPVPGANFPGRLWAGLVDHKKTFDSFVMKAAQRQEGAEKLFENRLYRQLSTNLAGSQDFTAMIRLLEVCESGQFDLVILDTPPSQHLEEFLQAPAKISALFHDGVARWFRRPADAGDGFLRRWVSGGARRVLKILESLTGAEFIRELSDFFERIQSWQDRLLERTSAVHRLLVAKETEFFLVTGIDRAKLMEASDFARSIRRGGHGLGGVLINRARPAWLDVPPPDFGDREDLRGIYDESLVFQEQVDRQIDEFAMTLREEAVIRRLPELLIPIHDLEGLEVLSRILERGPS